MNDTTEFHHIIKMALRQSGPYQGSVIKHIHLYHPTSENEQSYMKVHFQFSHETAEMLLKHLQRQLESDEEAGLLLYCKILNHD